MRICLLIGLLVGLLATAGCATVTKSAADNQASQRQIMELEMRQIADDHNLIWMTDRQNRLTRWITR
jgi:hypothetical protein